MFTEFLHFSFTCVQNIEHLHTYTFLKNSKLNYFKFKTILCGSKIFENYVLNALYILSIFRILLKYILIIYFNNNFY